MSSSLFIFSLLRRILICINTGVRKNAPGKIAPRKNAPEKIAPGNKPLKKIDPPEKCPQENCFTRFLLLLTLSYSSSFSNFL